MARQQSSGAGISQDWLSWAEGWRSSTPVCIECPSGMARCVAFGAFPSCVAHAMSADTKLNCNSSVERAKPVKRRSITNRSLREGAVQKKAFPGVTAIDPWSQREMPEPGASDLESDRADQRPIENHAHLSRELIRSERLLQKRRLAVQHSPPQDVVVGVA